MEEENEVIRSASGKYYDVRRRNIGVERMGRNRKDTRHIHEVDAESGKNDTKAHAARGKRQIQDGSDDRRKSGEVR